MRGAVCPFPHTPSCSGQGQLRHFINCTYLVYHKIGYRVFPGGKVRPGRAADTSPPSSAVVMEE